MLTFSATPQGHLVVRLGDVVLGSIADASGPKIKAWVLMRLPDITRSTRPATSIEAAKIIAESMVRDWCARAGIAQP